MSIEINNESGLNLDEVRIVQLASFALAKMHVHPDAELSIVCSDEETMAKLHEEFMDEPGPTDVLSFPMDELRPGTRSTRHQRVCSEISCYAQLLPRRRQLQPVIR